MKKLSSTLFNKIPIGTILQTILLSVIVVLNYGYYAETKHSSKKEEIQINSTSLSNHLLLMDTHKKKSAKNEDPIISEDTINALEVAFLDLLNENKLSEIEASFLSKETHDSLKLIYFADLNEQIGLVRKDSSINVQVHYTDSVSTVYYKNEIVHQWREETWWRSYYYVGYCENGQYDYFSTGGENIDYAIYMPDGKKHDYPYVFSANKDHYFFIDSYDDHSIYSSYLIVDNILNIQSQNFTLETPFWISNNEIVFTFSQMNDEEYPHEKPNNQEFIYVKLLII